MICMSYQGMLNLVKKLSEDHDIEIQEWADEIKNDLATSLVSVCVCACVRAPKHQTRDLNCS